MGQEVVKTNGSWEVPVESASSSVEGLMGGRSDGLQIVSVSQESDDVLTGSCSSGRSVRGLAGLQNLGNTCFMNSALQCLAHTPELVDYFLQDYSKEINQENPLGMEGELALAFGELIRKLWAGNEVFVPRSFKAKLSRFAPQFSGYNQHDSQELLAFLLDGLHEDLNRVKTKPYIEVKDGEGRPDAEVAEEYWANHKARNDSVIVDLFQGQYKSTLVCPICKKVSVTFDPFMYLSLPLPETMNLTVTVFSGDGSAAPQHYTVQVPRQARCRDLCQALSDACKLGKEEHLVVAKIDSNRIQERVMEHSLLSPRDGDCLAAYRLWAFTDKTSALILFHGHIEESIYSFKKYFYGAPFVASLPDEGLGTGVELYSLVKKVLSPLRRDFENADENSEIETSDYQWPFQLYMTDEKTLGAGLKIDPDASLPPTFNYCPGEHRYLVVDWTRKGLEQYDIKSVDLPQVFHCGSRRPRQEPISLYTCLEAFMKEEPLGPDDMWYCPRCKEHRQATKKLDLWRLPEILVVHLKRFSYSRFLKNKLDTFVDFPAYDLDMSKYVSCKTDPYELFAVSNHYGGMGGGHYTAYAKLCNENKWYNFDDAYVSAMSSEGIKTTAAYVLFYRRKRRAGSLSPRETCLNNEVSSLDDWADFTSAIPPSH